MQPHVAAVAGAINAEQRIAVSRRRLAVECARVLAAKVSRGVAHVDGHPLTRRARAVAQLGRGQRRGGNARLRRRPKAEGRRRRGSAPESSR